MAPEHWQRVKEICHLALDREPGEPAAFLEQRGALRQRNAYPSSLPVETFEPENDLGGRLAIRLTHKQESAASAGKRRLGWRVRRP
jgi:hypothetical protein